MSRNHREVICFNDTGILQAVRRRVCGIASIDARLDVLVFLQPSVSRIQEGRVSGIDAAVDHSECDTRRIHGEHALRRIGLHRVALDSNSVCAAGRSVQADQIDPVWSLVLGVDTFCVAHRVPRRRSYSVLRSLRPESSPRPIFPLLRHPPAAAPADTQASANPQRVPVCVGSARDKRMNPTNAKIWDTARFSALSGCSRRLPGQAASKVYENSLSLCSCPGMRSDFHHQLDIGTR